MNHEATTDEKLVSFFIHANRAASTLPRTAAEVDKELTIRRLSVVELQSDGEQWANKTGSAFNRRVTTMTEAAIHGPARGTLNNCGSGKAPWGPCVSGEENGFASFHREATVDDARRKDKQMQALNRHGHKGRRRQQGGPSHRRNARSWNGERHVGWGKFVGPGRQLMVRGASKVGLLFTRQLGGPAVAGVTARGRAGPPWPVRTGFATCQGTDTAPTRARTLAKRMAWRKLATRKVLCTTRSLQVAAPKPLDGAAKPSRGCDPDGILRLPHRLFYGQRIATKQCGQALIQHGV